MMEHTFSLMMLIGVQVITESFPISSSTHLFLARELLSWMSESFRLFLASHHASVAHAFSHFPTILIIILFFKESWIALFYRLPKQLPVLLNSCAMTFIADCATIIVVTIIRYIWPYRLELYQGQIVTTFFLVSTFFCKNRIVSLPLTYRTALLLGSMQGLAYGSGFSRLASTYALGCFLGLSARKSFSVSWMIFFPFMCADFFLALVQWYPVCSVFLVNFYTLIGLAILVVIGLAGMQLSFLLALNHYWWCYGWYTTLLACVLVVKRFYKS